MEITAVTSGGTPPQDDAPLADPAEIRRAMEYYADRGWTDGLPVVPVTESYLAEFLALTRRDPDDVVMAMPHLNRRCTVRLAAINAALAGCRPEYFPVVLAAWESLTKDGAVTRAIWQSTTGTAPFLIVNGPIREAIGLNSKGNVFGSGFRANATIGRAIRLTAINAFGLRPRQLDQATQGSLAKYSACIAENEEDSPWPPLHVDHGFDPADSTVTAMVIRSFMHIEARHTTAPEQLAMDFVTSICRTGVLVHSSVNSCLVLGPEHAHVFDRAGWGKAEIQRFLCEHATMSRADLAVTGKDGMSRHTRWRLPANHPDALPSGDNDIEADPLRILTSPAAILVVVAGADNAGVSAIIEPFGAPGRPVPAITKISAPG